MLPFSQRRRVGIVLDEGRATAALVRIGRHGRAAALGHATVRLPAGTWTAAEPGFDTVFRKLAGDLGRAARRADVPASVALPDPLVMEELLVFRDFPATAQAADELVRWRLGRDYRIDAADIACTWEHAGRNDDGVQILARSLPASRVRDIAGAAERAGLWLDRLEGLARFGAVGQTPGATVAMTYTWWSVTVTLAQSAAPRVYADWRMPADAGADLRRIARILRTIVMTKAVGRLPVRIAAEAGERGALASALAGDLLEVSEHDVESHREAAERVARG